MNISEVEIQFHFFNLYMNARNMQNVTKDFSKKNKN